MLILKDNKPTWLLYGDKDKLSVFPSIQKQCERIVLYQLYGPCALLADI